MTVKIQVQAECDSPGCNQTTLGSIEVVDDEYLGNRLSRHINLPDGWEQIGYGSTIHSYCPSHRRER